MSNLNTILNKLGKIEEIHETNLGKHEIELSAIDNLLKKYKTLGEELGNRLVVELQKIDSIINESNNIKSIVNKYKPLEQDIDKISKMLNELGIGDEFTHEVFSWSINADNRLKNVDKHITTLNDSLAKAKWQLKQIGIPDALTGNMLK
jgi:hypothetical protein